MPSVGFTEMLTGRCGLNEEWAVRIWCDLLLLTQTDSRPSLQQITHSGIDPKTLLGSNVEQTSFLLYFPFLKTMQCQPDSKLFDIPAILPDC